MEKIGNLLKESWVEELITRLKIDIMAASREYKIRSLRTRKKLFFRCNDNAKIGLF